MEESDVGKALTQVINMALNESKTPVCTAYCSSDRNYVISDEIFSSLPASKLPYSGGTPVDVAEIVVRSSETAAVKLSSAARQSENVTLVHFGDGRRQAQATI
jgi:hypothetical protein